jgi:ribose transport system ATP-binding protein
VSARLIANGIDKAFLGTPALEKVALQIRKGSIHAVLGENGAGKSTLMQILAGAQRPDAGTLLLDGVPYAPRDPAEARRAGVAIVYQELSVCPDLTVAENVLLGAEPRRFGWILRDQQARRAERALSQLTRDRAQIPLDAFVRELSSAERQLVEIARALSRERTKLLILDEPTSSLGGAEVERLFAALSSLRDAGLSIVYISHFLEEVRRVADDYTVLRDGRTVATGKVAEVSNDQLVVEMAGRTIERSQKRDHAPGEVLLSLRDLGGERLPERASLELRRGEVVGLAGLVGSGRTELVRAVFGLDPVRRGDVRVRAERGPRSPARRWAEGVGLVSEDRKGEGLLLNLSISQNVTLAAVGRLKRHGILSLSEERRRTAALIQRLGIRCRGPDQIVSELSGGNQQKVALARLLFHEVDLFLLDEPTRGIDVRSRAEIHALIDDLSLAGKSVLIVSSYLPELLSVCDRIAVMHRGVLGPLRASNECTEHALLHEATGA